MLSAPQEVERLLDQIRVVTAGNSVVERATDQISVLCRAHLASLPDTSIAERFHLTRREERVFNAIFGRRGQVIGKPALLDAVYFDEPQEASEKIIDVFVCKIRAKTANSEYSVETIWGRGFRGLIAA